MATDPVLSMTLQERHRQLPGTGPTMPVEMGRDPAGLAHRPHQVPRSQLGEKALVPQASPRLKEQSQQLLAGEVRELQRKENILKKRDERFNTSAAVTQCPGCSSGMDVPSDTYLGAVLQKTRPTPAWVEGGDYMLTPQTSWRLRSEAPGVSPLTSRPWSVSVPSSPGWPGAGI